jgi:cell wall-associated NlpC family hydrolase
MEMRKKIITSARTWLGTPFVHQGRVKGKGCDCLGFIIGVGNEVGIKIKNLPIKEFDDTNYTKIPDGKLLKKNLDNLLKPKIKSSAKPGDIFLMNFGGNPQHLGIFSDYPNSPATAIIHCYSGSGKVVEHRLDDFWFAKIEQVYSITD